MLKAEAKLRLLAVQVANVAAVHNAELTERQQISLIHCTQLLRKVANALDPPGYGPARPGRKDSRRTESR